MGSFLRDVLDTFLDFSERMSYVASTGMRPLATFPSVEWGCAPLACCTVPVHGMCLPASSEVGKCFSCIHAVLAVGYAHLP